MQKLLVTIAIILWLDGLRSTQSYFVDLPSTSFPLATSKILVVAQDTQRLQEHQAKNNQSTQDLNGVDFENILTSNNGQLKVDYQPSVCQMVPVVHLLHHHGCQPKAIASFACSGSCPSHVRTSSSKFWQHERSCSCCQQTGSQEATFALDCPSLDPPYRKVKTYAPVECLCRSCTDLGREDLRPQELVEALASEMNNGDGPSFEQ